MRIRSAVRATALASLFAAVAAPARAQCQLAWRPGPGVIGTDAFVFDVTMWDRDGAGPAPELLVLAGDFTKAGPLPAAHVATWNPANAEWGTLGGGPNGDVWTLGTAANGDLIVGGSFYAGGGQGIARWNGSSWASFGIGVNGRVNDVAVLPNGDVVAVGTFTTAGTAPANRVARWNGASWSPLGSGSPSELRAVLALPNGDIIVGGEFTSIGGVAANRIAHWNGTSWSPLGSGVDGTIFSSSIIAVNDLVLMPSGDVIAGGNFTTAGGIATTGAARWDGASWSSLPGLGWSVGALHLRPDGTLVANAPVGTGSATLSWWDGSSWQPLAPGLPFCACMATLPGGDLVAAGDFTFTSSGGQTVLRMARWDGTSWSALAQSVTPWFTSALEPGINAIAATQDGTLYAIGYFQVVNGQLLNGIARLNGTTWGPVGSGLGIGSWPFPYPYPSTIRAMQNGDVVVGGLITNIEGGPAGNVVRWNGSSWSNLGGGVNSRVNALAELPNGDLLVAGEFATAGGTPANRVARWDGATWHALGMGTDAGVASLLVMPTGDVLAAGAFTSAGGVPANRVARWDGAAWSPLGAGHTTGVGQLRLLPNGDVVACFQGATWGAQPSIRRWNGATWTQLGADLPGNLFELVVLPDGGLLASGSSGWGAYTLRWSGGVWSSFAGTDHPFSSSAWLPDGDLVVTGAFDSAGQYLSPTMARLGSTCPAAAVVTGAGCPGSGGANTLAATALPWIGATFRAQGTGLPTLAIVSQVFGLAPMQLPLSIVFAEAPLGCDLLVTPDFVQFSVTTDGTATTALAIPADPALIGVQVHHQLNLFEVDTGLHFVQITASNALQLTIGVF